VYAVTIPEPGPAEVLTWAEVPDPEPGPDEVLIEVAASAVNRADLLQRSGAYPPPMGAPPYPGLECSGRIVATGAAVREWRIGDEVCALLAGGGYAQQVAVPAAHLLPIPPGVSIEDAAGLPEVACTVWSNLFDLGRLHSGQSVLIHGGGSGIGTLAIQLASAHGAYVLTTARPSKHAALRELGARVVIDHVDEDFVDVAREHTDGRGVDLILDIMGASHLEQNLNALVTGGHLIIIGLQGGFSAQLNLSALLAKRATISGTTLRSRTAADKAAIIASVREHVWPLLASGRIRPIVHSRLPMPEAASAHRLVQSSRHLGKVLLLAPR
jgi:putative PIG3 family NAD(P)H quinone oxidoreductase